MEAHAKDRTEAVIRTLLDLSNNNSSGLQSSFGDFTNAVDTCKLGGCPFIVNDTTTKVERVFARDYVTGLDWDTGFNLPSFFQGSLNLTPTVSFQKVDGRSPLVVRTERTGGKFLVQSMRPSYGVSLAPKLYRFFPGFGPVAAIRHSIEPNLQFAFTPKGNVSNEFLAAMGDIAQGYLGNNEQNTISLGLSYKI